MKQLARILFFLLLLFAGVTGTAQNDSCRLRISVLTCAPGEELYSLFGHSAIRVTDSSRYTDVVFNYGTFDFTDPDFYMKFVKGRMDFFVSAESFSDFIQSYQAEQRSVVEQNLNLNCAEKEKLFAALKENLLPQNRFYKYDILFDNCTTRIGDLLRKYIGGFSVNKALTPPGTTYRNLLHNYLDQGGSPWSKLGIDILLGSNLDKKVTIQQSMFLPQYTEKGIDSAVAANHSHMVSNKNVLFEAPALNDKRGRYLPLGVMAVVLLLLLVLSRVKKPAVKTALRIIDSLLLYVTGLTGILLVFLWVAREDILCRNNYNLFWALPTNFIAAFFIWKKPSWVRKYFLYAAFLQLGLLLFWFVLPQQLNIALVPVVVLLVYRYFQLSKN